MNESLFSATEFHIQYSGKWMGSVFVCRLSNRKYCLLLYVDVVSPLRNLVKYYWQSLGFSCSKFYGTELGPTRIVGIRSESRFFRQSICIFESIPVHNGLDRNDSGDYIINGVVELKMKSFENIKSSWIKYTLFFRASTLYVIW